MKEYPLVSIIIPTKNEEHNITRCLTSIKQQTYQGKTEIILVDNYSKDKTVSIAKKLGAQTILAGNERSQQRNIGAKAAHGVWLLFLDADMELMPDVIQETITLIQSKINFPIIAISEKSIGYTFLTKAIALEKNCYNRAGWLLAARFFPRKYFLQLEGYDVKLIAGEDWDLTQRFQSAGFSLMMIKDAFVIHHEAKISLRKLLQKEIYYIQHIDRYAKKHPFAFSYQGSMLYRLFIWVRMWSVLIRHPLLTITFLFYKSIVWLIWQWSKRSIQFMKTLTKN